MGKKRIYLLIFLFPLVFGCNEANIDRISLNGIWKITLSPSEGFEKNDMDTSQWRNIQVPGEALMQGFAIKQDDPFVYKKEIEIPSAYKGKDIKLYFEGVYSYARVWVNGTYIRDHRGGFTPWECDITSHVTPSDKASITVEVTDESRDYSYGSGYAKHPIGGILRDVYIKALPHNRIDKFVVETYLDEEYRDATLALNLDLLLQKDAELSISLNDPEGKVVNLTENEIQLLASDSSKVLEFQVINPFKWDAEHPHLYTLKLELTQDGTVIQELIQKVGFREIEINGNQMLVNGIPVKLRGANRHVVHPLLGRVDTPEYDLRDAELAKEANMNFIRTSHYPPSQRFADIADSLGIYLMVESAACFLNQRKSDMPPPDYAHLRDSTIWSLDQVEAMVQTFRNNPSVAIWSIANESRFDEYFAKELEYVKSEDPTRPVIISHSRDAAKRGLIDISSRHYIKYSAPVSQFGRDDMPLIHDEWLHISAYNQQTLRTDLNVREFWGASLDTMWMKAHEAEGSLGGAIWNMIDDTFMVPDTTSGFGDWWGVLLPLGSDGYQSTTVGYGEWGFIDVWRRKKPEFWSVKKAYSPVLVLTRELEQIPPNQPIELEIFNRFDNTNLNEINVKWEYEGLSGTVSGTDIAPHETGVQTIPGQDWKDGSKLTVSFLNADNQLIDIYEIKIGEVVSSDIVYQKGEQGDIEIVEHMITRPRFEGTFFRGNVSIVDEMKAFTVKGSNFSIQFNSKTGLINAGVFKGDTLITGGPFLRLTLMGETLGNRRTEWDYLTPDWESNWKLDSLNKKTVSGEFAEITINGTYNDTLSASFLLTINGKGDIKTAYSYAASTGGLINLGEGGFDEESTYGISSERGLIEVGITYQLSPNFDKLSWNRESYWSAYPESHLGRSTGEEDLRNYIEEKYRATPKKDWVHDIKSFYYKGLNHPTYGYHLPNTITALKENIYDYTLTKTSSDNTLSIVSNASVACRIDQTDPDKLTLVINNLWDYPDIYWGAYMKNIQAPEKYENKAVMIFNK